MWTQNVHALENRGLGTFDPAKLCRIIMPHGGGTVDGKYFWSDLVWNGSIWLDMAWYYRQIDRTDVAHLCCFQEIIKTMAQGPKKRPMTPFFPRGPKRRPMTPKIWHGMWNHDMPWHGTGHPAHNNRGTCHAIFWHAMPCQITPEMLSIYGSTCCYPPLMVNH